MDNTFVDVDILLTRIRNPQSRTYFLDSVKAYKAGALRASMTSLWVALVYDLISKYRELSALGDAAATAYIHDWDTATASNDVSKLLKLEASLLDDATTNTQVVNQIANTHLKRLRDDRHLCAHPAYSAEAELFEPTPELVRLHLVNAVDLVLAQEPLQGKAILDLYDADIQSPGFPTEPLRLFNYVKQRYLARVRAQNIRNFGAVIAKSLLKGVPAGWEAEQRKVRLSLVALRDRAPDTWGDVSQGIVRLIDGLGPGDRSRAIAFIGVFPDFWPLLQDPTRTVLQATVDAITPATLGDYRILDGIQFHTFRPALMNLVSQLEREQLAEAISGNPRDELWTRAIELYRASGGWRASEANFRDLITPYAGTLNDHQSGQLLDAIIANGQNWDAAETSNRLLNILKLADDASLPQRDARDRFYLAIRRAGRLRGYGDALTVLQRDGWTFPPYEQEED